MQWCYDSKILPEKNANCYFEIDLVYSFLCCVPGQQTENNQLKEDAPSFTPVKFPI